MDVARPKEPLSFFDPLATTGPHHRPILRTPLCRRSPPAHLLPEACCSHQVLLHFDKAKFHALTPPVGPYDPALALNAKHSTISPKPSTLDPRPNAPYTQSLTSYAPQCLTARASARRSVGLAHSSAPPPWPCASPVSLPSSLPHRKRLLPSCGHESTCIRSLDPRPACPCFSLAR